MIKTKKDHFYYAIITIFLVILFYLFAVVDADKVLNSDLRLKSTNKSNKVYFS